jgi:hypothetical protein
VAAVRSAVLRLASSGSTEPRISAPPVDPPTTKLSTPDMAVFLRLEDREHRGAVGSAACAGPDGMSVMAMAV